MITIHKYRVDIDDNVTIVIPVGAHVLTVQEQAGIPCIWAIVDDSAGREVRKFHWRGTGHPLGVVGSYIGTVQLGALVFHLFHGEQS